MAGRHNLILEGNNMSKTLLTDETTLNTEPERVELFVPRGSSNDDPNLLIGLNGVNYLLPRGKTSLVPPAIKAEYERSVRAQEKMDRRIDEMLESAREK
jgi:hypothetical protein